MLDLVTIPEDTLAFDTFSVNQTELLSAAHADPIGYETLKRMATVERYNDWIYEVLAPFAGQRLLEVGCGIGNMTEYNIPVSAGSSSPILR